MRRYYHWINDYIRNEKGMALVVVLLVITIVSILGLGIMAYSMNNLKMASMDRNYQSTYYIAESGITLMEGQMNQTATNLCSNVTKSADFVNGISDFTKTFVDADFSKTFGQQPSANVNARVTSRDTSNGTVNVLIQSQGMIGNSSRNLTKSIQLKCTPGTSSSPLSFINDMALFTNNKIYYNGNIFGSFGTNCNGNCTGASPITVDWGANYSDFSGLIYAPNGGTAIYSKPSSMKFSPTVNNISARPFGTSGPYNPPDFPVYPTDLPKRTNIVASNDPISPITADGYYDQISLQGGTTLTIDVGTSERKIVVNKLFMYQGFIKLKGTGKLTMYIGSDFIFGGIDKNGVSTGGGSSTINADGNSEKLNIYYNGPNLLNLGGQIQINGNVYTLNSNINMAGSGCIVGNIIAPNAATINITGGANSINHFILAPKATVNVTNGGTVVGSIISNEFNLTGGATLKYGKIDDSGGVSFYPPSSSSSGSLTISPLIPIREN